MDLELLLEKLDLNASQFADAIGVQRATISHIISGRNNPSLDFIQKLMAKFPEINPDWVITGEGDMLRSALHEDHESIPPTQSGEKTAPVQSGLFDEEWNTEASKDLASETKSKKHGNLQARSADMEKTGAQIEKKIVSRVIILYNDGTFEDYQKR